ncbi:hypothetical protein [Algoriphagus boritolerans]|uniref:hypothetical protein n=1 Tax=Algoriphagus boritolerans TaxID=308111 RepID=UPI002FCDFA88
MKEKRGSDKGSNGKPKVRRSRKARGKNPKGFLLERIFKKKVLFPEKLEFANKVVSNLKWKTN